MQGNQSLAREAGETVTPGRRIPRPSDSVNRKTSTTASAKVFIGGVEITQPDLFNNGMHGGYSWPSRFHLSALSVFLRRGEDDLALVPVPSRSSFWSTYPDFRLGAACYHAPDAQRCHAPAP